MMTLRENLRGAWCAFWYFGVWRFAILGCLIGLAVIYFSVMMVLSFQDNPREGQNTPEVNAAIQAAYDEGYRVGLFDGKMEAWDFIRKHQWELHDGQKETDTLQKEETDKGSASSLHGPEV